MKRNHFISLVFTFFIEAKSLGILHSDIFNTNKTDNKLRNDIARSLFSFSVDTDDESKIGTLGGTKEALQINGELQQDRKYITYKEIGEFMKSKSKFRKNLTGLIDFENVSSDSRPTNLYNDEALLQGNTGKSFGKESRLNGFDMSDPKDNPYAVMLVEFLEDHAYFGICSGALVTLEWVLTAASHCFSLADVYEIEIHAGGYSKKEWLENKFRPGHQMIPSADYFVHPSYEERESFVDYYDVALVKADRQFKSTRSVSVVMISTEPWMYKKWKMCKVTGFGKVQYFEKHSGDYVRKTHTLSMKSPCPCLENEKNPRTWICARPRENFGICGNDWGAALVCNGKLTAVATEVIAFHDFHTCVIEDEPYCAKNNSLSVFQNIYFCLSWINEYVDLLQFDEPGVQKKGSGDFKERGLAFGLRFSLVVVLSCTSLTQLLRVFL